MLASVNNTDNESIIIKHHSSTDKPIGDSLSFLSCPSLARTSSFGETSSIGNSTIESVVKSEEAYNAKDVDEEKELLSSVITCIYSPSDVASKKGFLPLLEARGGTDKDPVSNHRRDSIPIAECIAPAYRTEIISYLEEDSVIAKRTNDAIRKYLLREASGVILRVNPGTLSPFSQKKLDDMLRELSSAGVKVMSQPEVQRKMGAKDALVKIKGLKCGLEDTEVYYTQEEFELGFRKSIAFRPRVLKQNRGSQGEGIWIVKLRSNMYCKTYGERIVGLGEELELMEANDNHVEYHSVGEFLEFCINGRTSKSGLWESSGNGKYLEGGVENGAMLVDQRFLPRIVEGEVRCLMVGSNMVSIVHKKPKEGGLSATLQSGAKYTNYDPDDEKFSSLVENFRVDLPNVMDAFGLSNEPLPLLWTADYIFGDDCDEEGKDKFYVGEFNCACVGITQQLHFADIVAKVAIETCFDER